MNWSARRINAAAAINRARRYLEIGVRAGETFRDVEIECKDGVDPDFAFDPKLCSSDRVRLFSQPSDEFWGSGHPTTYDLIFIDGLHTFEQTVRDLISSLRFSHPRTIWLIDDTLPCDVISAIPDQERSFHERKRLGLPGQPWHGDVFKVVPAIHDFLPVLRYATIVGSGNAQTLAWYAPRPNFKPHLNDWEAISRLTYFDIEPKLWLFNAMDEDAALATLRAELGEGDAAGAGTDHPRASGGGVAFSSPFDHDGG